jgi:hypothetical protein
MDSRKEVKAEQAGGHTDAFIKTPDGKIKKMSKEAEYSFYETLKNRKIPEHIRSFFPKFYGIETIGNRRIRSTKKRMISFFFINIISC